MRQGLLLTGAILSGKRWISRKLIKAGDLPYFHEPLNPLSPPGLPLKELQTTYPFIENNDHCPYTQKVSQYLRGYVPWWRSIQEGRSIRDKLSLLKANYQRRKAFENGPVLIKCPFSVFSAGFYMDQMELDLVFSLRNPLDLVAAAKQQSDHRNFQELAQNSALIDHCFPQFKDQIQSLAVRCSENDLSTVECVTHYWIFVYTYVMRLWEQYGTDGRIHFVSLIQLNQDPQGEFERLFARLEKRLGRPFKPVEDVVSAEGHSSSQDSPPTQRNMKVWDRETTYQILSEQECQFVTEKTANLLEEVSQMTGMRL